MTLRGCLSEFSLGEIFQLIEQGEKTGLLSVREWTLNNNFSLEDYGVEKDRYYIWFYKGRVIAAQHNQLNNKGLQMLIQKRGWLEDSVSDSHGQFCDRATPLGLCLKSLGILNPNQLRILFVTQVMREVCTLFKLDKGFFQFEPDRKPSLAEMTGLSKPPTELTLIGLRMLKNWTPLAEKLPEPTSGLVRLMHSHPCSSLNDQERNVWEYANGKSALKTIAQALELPMEKVQQIAFRLIVTGLVEELPMVEMIPPEEETPTEETPPAVSHSFLNHLTSFLQKKAS